MVRICSAILKARGAVVWWAGLGRELEGPSMGSSGAVAAWMFMPWCVFPSPSGWLVLARLQAVGVSFTMARACPVAWAGCCARSGWGWRAGGWFCVRMCHAVAVLMLGPAATVVKVSSLRRCIKTRSAYWAGVSLCQGAPIFVRWWRAYLGGVG